MKSLLELLVVSVMALCIKAQVTFNSENKPTSASLYAQQNMPVISGVKDQLEYQISLCDKNLNKLNRLSNTLSENHSKKVLQNKINLIEEEKSLLRGQLSKVNTEIEKSLIMSEFNEVDLGGERQSNIKEIIKSSEQNIKSAQQVNAQVATFYKE